ncbi:MAG: HAD family phosphatase [Paramuribaculum sp.]|nr:HAD family phosphatase [Paramuribaculum sp.]
MKGALFDLDGVLIDSETLYTGFWENIDKLYPTGIPNFAIKIKGTTLDMIFRHFPDADVQADILRRLNRFQQEMRFEMYPYAEDFLRRLRAAGIPIALVTSSDEKKMDSLFAQLPTLRDYFDAIIHAGLITHSKPHPEPYLKGAQAIGISPDECCVFEDSLQGLAAGRASGAKVVALATTYPADRLADLADMVVSDFKDLDISRL